MITESVDKKKNGEPTDKIALDRGTKSGESQALNERFSSVIACVDGSHVSKGVIPHAQTLALALRIRLQLLTVLEPDHESEAPFDPVEWSLRRREAENFLGQLVDEYRLDSANTILTILEGKSAVAISNCLRSTQQEVTVFCRKDDQEHGHFGSTSRSVLERCSGSIFIVPARAATSRAVQYQRIMVPLDGSPRAESVLPTISTLARACDATVVIVQATPSPEVTASPSGDQSSGELKAALNKHNEWAATQYLDRVNRRLRESGVAVESRVLPSGDTRRQLIDAITQESIDLVVLSSHGVSGYGDVPFGDVAGHIMSRSPVPTLMLRDLMLSSTATVMGRLSDTVGRTPEGAD